MTRILAFTTALLLVTVSTAGQDPVQVTPKNCKSLLENDRVRVGSASHAVHEEVLTRSDYFVDSESGARLFVRRVTAASNQHIPILLVHGGSPPSEVIFDLPVPGYALAEDLARMGLDVFLMDARGWGKSTSPHSESQPLGESKDVVADIGSVIDDIIRTTGRRRVWFFGHASGGHWAAMYAVQHPDKTAGLVLLNSIYGVDAPWGLRQGFEDPQHPGVFDVHAGPYRLATAEGLLDGWNRSIPVANKNEWRDPRVAEAYVTLGLASDPTSESRTPPSLKIPGAFRRDHYLLSKGQKFWDAHDLKCPVLYMRGSRDHWSRPEDLEGIKRDVGNRIYSRFVTIQDGTHFLFLDRPGHGRAEMLNQIRDFIKDGDLTSRASGETALAQDSAIPNSLAAAARNEIQLVEKLLPQLPDRAPALFLLAHDYAAIGDQNKALSLLEECISLREGFNPEQDREFAAMKETPGFQALVAQVRQDFPAVHRAKLAFTIDDNELLPEGLAADRRGHFLYMGSLAEQKIVKIKAGVVTDFVASGQYDLHSICGVKVDASNQDVWAAVCRDSGKDAELLHFSAKGKLVERFSPQKPGQHLFNDLVLRNANEIYLTDSLAGHVLRFDRKRRTFTALDMPRPLYYPNGIAVSNDGNLLFIADAFGVLQYDLRSGKGHEVHPGKSNTLSGIDGLYWYRGSLIGIQGLGMARVARFQLDPAGLRVTKTTVLEYRSDFVESPTTGAIDGSAFYFMANTQIDHWKDEKIEDPDKLVPVRVAVVPLQ